MLKRWLVRQVLVPWLRARALELPHSKRTELADRLNIPEDIIARIEEELREYIIRQLEEKR